MGRLNFHNKPRLVFSLIAFICVGPLLLSYILVKSPDSFDLGNRSHGVLLQPPVPLGAKELIAWTNKDGEDNQTAPVSLQGHWSLLYWAGSDCSLPCIEKTLHMERMRQALGRHAYRLRNVILFSASPPRPPLQQSPIFLWLADGDGDPLLNLHKKKRIEGPGQIYVIDPLGNLLMTYDGDADPSGIVKDLELLMRASKIG